MDAEFWHERWERGQLGFHQADFNALMVAHFGRLGLAPGARVFVPLCGKTRDIAWLLGRGFAVAGAELSSLAVEQLFADLDLDPQVAQAGALTRHSGPGTDIFAGDIFDLYADRLGPVDAVYDRAALVALPREMRADYARHLHRITSGAPQFLLTFEFDQSAMAGPPFSVDRAEVERANDGIYAVEELARRTLPGKLKGIVSATETAWALR